MTILLSVTLFVVGIFVGAYMGHTRLNPRWTILNEIEWWINIFSRRF